MLRRSDNLLSGGTNLVAGPIGYVALAVQPQARAVGIEHHHRVEERVVAALEKADGEDLYHRTIFDETQSFYAVFSSLRAMIAGFYNLCFSRHEAGARRTSYANEPAASTPDQQEEYR